MVQRTPSEKNQKQKPYGVSITIIVNTINKILLKNNLIISYQINIIYFITITYHIYTFLPKKHKIDQIKFK